MFDYPPSKTDKDKRMEGPAREEEEEGESCSSSLEKWMDGWTSGPDRKPTIDYQACYYTSNGAAFFVAKNWFLMPGSSLSCGRREAWGGETRRRGGSLTPVITILSAPMTTRAYTRHRVLEVRGLWERFGFKEIGVEWERVLQCVSRRNISGYNLAKGGGGGYRDLHPDPPLLTRAIYHDARGRGGRAN